MTKTEFPTWHDERLPTGMPRLAVLLAIVVLPLACGCTWQQAYYSAQGWQRNMCNRVVEQTERERCLNSASMSYEDYRRQSSGDQN
jgi:hypothetical protein